MIIIPLALMDAHINSGKKINPLPPITCVDYDGIWCKVCWSGRNKFQM